MHSRRHAALAVLVVALGFCAAQARASVIFSDNFTYPDGPLVGAPGSPWANHSGTAGQVNVTSNQVELTQRRPDVPANNLVAQTTEVVLGQRLATNP